MKSAVLPTPYAQLLLHSNFSDCVAVLRGAGLRREHCALENSAGTVTVFPQDGALCSVNGSVVTEPCQLTQGKHFHKNQTTSCSNYSINEREQGET